ncbi:MAG: PfkB family carbohydrate kinase [Alphaproteobacteria bacterium]
MIDERYRHKIKTLDELRAIIGSRPRARRVVMCHGTFDLVHPGHIRHLLYARSKGDVLVASLTCDAHVTKADHRPYVPEDLRALNLAALEAVDYVIVDPNQTPLANLAVLQPDLFVKGFEYNKDGLHPKTAEEVRVVEGYGGSVLFSPGDIVFSSSAIIDRAPPNLAYDKLAMLLRAEGLGLADLRTALDRLGGCRVHVVGDTIVDVLTHTSMIGANAKTPTMSVRYEGESRYVGGAGIVAKHLRAAGAAVLFSTVLGADELQGFVLDDLEAAGVEVDAVVDDTRPTTSKTAIVAGGYRLLKIDRLDNRAISAAIVDRLAGRIAAAGADVVVFSDFRHGLFSPQTIPALNAAIPAGAYKVADSQVASRWGNILDFKGFDLITPNEKEARFALGDQDTVVRPLGSRLYDAAGCRTLILKLGARGLITFRRPLGEDDDRRTFFALDSFAASAADPVGAGDALLAMPRSPCAAAPARSPRPCSARSPPRSSASARATSPSPPPTSPPSSTPSKPLPLRHDHAAASRRRLSRPGPRHVASRIDRAHRGPCVLRDGALRAPPQDEGRRCGGGRTSRRCGVACGASGRRCGGGRTSRRCGGCVRASGRRCRAAGDAAGVARCADRRWGNPAGRSDAGLHPRPPMAPRRPSS